jgi:hypothetical protein
VYAGNVDSLVEDAGVGGAVTQHTHDATPALTSMKCSPDRDWQLGTHHRVAVDDRRMKEQVHGTAQALPRALAEDLGAYCVSRSAEREQPGMATVIQGPACGSRCERAGYRPRGDLVPQRSVDEAR